MKYQVCVRDEYGQSSIISTFDDVNKAVADIEKCLFNDNIDNALTADDKKNNWESYGIFIQQKKPDNGEYMPVRYVYAGKNGSGKHIVYENDSLVLYSDIKDKVNLNIYLGELDGKAWMLSDPKGNIIDDIDADILRTKNFYFIKFV